MNVQTSFRPAVIEALKTLWVALPVRAPGDFGDDTTDRNMAILDAYCFALSEMSSEAIWNTVNALRAGKIDDASRDFCPKAPKLAEYARAEQRRLDAINRPKAVSYQPVSQPWKDWRIIQRRRTEELAEQGYRLAAENMPLDNAVTMARRKTWRPGSRWFWALQETWEPKP